jgi:hypothetical protein
LGEIEDYTRVDLDVPGEMLVSPSVIGDLILMMAELMENATRFSPPQTRVTVSARSTADGLHLSIVDQGIGLSDARLAAENARLARRERLDLAPTEVLGLFVVGRLARRHGAIVKLSHTAGGGITASLVFPPSVLVSQVLGATVPAALAGRTVTVGPASGATSGPATGPAASAATGRSGATAVALAHRGPVATRIPAVDVSALERVNEALDSGLTWNAFDPTPAAPPVPAAPPEMPNALRQRVPGAQLPATSAPAVAMSAAPVADASAVRDLVEAFEGGVRRAQDLVGRPPTDPPTPPTPPTPSTPPMPLSRRVPGATVDPVDHRMFQRTGTPQLDPDQALRRIQQIEQGVARALDEIHAEQERGNPA